MTIIDLSQPISTSTPTYPGDPVVEISQTAFLSKEGHNNYQIKIGMHVGTHIDAPLHMIDGGKTIADYPTEKFIGPGKLVNAKSKDSIDADLLTNLTINKGDIVLIYTGFSEKFFDSEYFTSYPVLTKEFAQKLIDLGVKLVGLDAASPDKPPFETHKLLLGSDVLIIENLTNLDKLVSINKFEVVALPAKLSTEAAQARVIARVI